jgi:hypothetical protein
MTILKPAPMENVDQNPSQCVTRGLLEQTVPESDKRECVLQHKVSAPKLGCMILCHSKGADSMGIPEDPLGRRKWMLKLWREDYGKRFSVFDPEDQPAPELGSWNPDMWEPYDPKPDGRGDFDPKTIRHIRWFECTKEFLQDRHGLAIGPDLFFDCRAMKCQGRFSEDIAPEKERLWYIRALRIGTFLFSGKLGVGFSCRSLGCQRKRCPLNLKDRDREDRLNRVDLYQLLQIFEGEAAMPLARAVAQVSQWFGVPLHGFGQAYCAVPKQSVYRQIQRYQKDIPALIRNFSNLCRRSPPAYFDIKPPTDEAYQDRFFFPEAMITEGILAKINSPAVVTYLYSWMLKMEQVQQNRFRFSLPTLLEMERDAESRGFKISARTIQRHLQQLETLQVLDKFSGPIL